MFKQALAKTSIVAFIASTLLFEATIARPSTFMLPVLLTLSFIISLVAHEYGHYFVAIKLNLNPEINLVVLRVQTSKSSRRNHFYVALGGIIPGMIIGIIALIVFFDNSIARYLTYLIISTHLLQFLPPSPDALSFIKKQK